MSAAAAPKSRAGGEWWQSHPTYGCEGGPDDADDDSIRVLVDRRWPRGVSKARAELDERRTVVAPSDALRKWYGHAPDRFEEFIYVTQGARRPGTGFGAPTSPRNDLPID